MVFIRHPTIQNLTEFCYLLTHCGSLACQGIIRRAWRQPSRVVYFVMGVLLHIFRTPFLKKTSGRLLLTCITLEKPLESFQVTKRPYTLSFLHKGENVFEGANILSRCFSKKLGFLNISKYLYIKKLIMGLFCHYNCRIFVYILEVSKNIFE